MKPAVLLLLVTVFAFARATTPRERAEDAVAQMTAEEKCAYMNGLGYAEEESDTTPGWFIGNLPENARFGIPALKMQDAAQGFRTSDSRLVGQVTAWPCALALITTWDTALVEEWAYANAREFKAKGANFILGPSLNLARVARNGRNAEYMSGEDPFLGATMVRPYVKANQEAGLLTTVKHWALNNQETLRESVDAHADERTLWELYYPPFQAAVDAEAASFMCAYNRVNTTWACENDELLNRDLKGRMGFEGFVMSDWWATHSQSAEQGLDIDMPGNKEDFFSCANIVGGASLKRIDDAVTRIITEIFKWKIDEPPANDGEGTCECSPPNCDPCLFETNATSAAQVALARRIAAKSAVLLKNEGGVLPIDTVAVSTLGVVGGACDAENDVEAQLDRWDVGNYYALGGSGRVIAANPVTILAGITARAAAAGVRVVSSASDDLEAALAVVEAADLVIACGGTTSSEGYDRDDLYLDNDVFLSALLAEAAAGGAGSTPIVVAMTTPGATLTPWRNDAAAVVNMFLAGEEGGNGWADVLFGDVAPSGKLPMTFPATAEDTIEPCNFDDKPCDYSEGLRMGYRSEAPFAFPFGHGLTYGTWNYTWSVAPQTGAQCGGGGDVVACFEVCVAPDLPPLSSAANRGDLIEISEVVQIYLGFPEIADNPPKILRNFARVMFGAGDRSPRKVAFELTERDVSAWSVQSARFLVVEGSFDVYVGSSSHDIRLAASFNTSSSEPWVPPISSNNKS